MTEIARNNTFNLTSTVGYSGTSSRQFLLFKDLIRLGNCDEIKYYINSSNAIVRIYSWIILKYKNSHSSGLFLKPR